MTQLLLDQTFQRTLDVLVGKYGAGRGSCGDVLEAWVFDDLETRRAATERLAQHGITAYFHSAYKPLVYFFLEELADRAVRAVTVYYPAPTETPRRFLLEAYPLAGILGKGVALTWEPMAVKAATTRYIYDVQLTCIDGTIERHSVEAPNRWHRDHVDSWQLSPCGWIRWCSAAGELRDDPFQTDYEQIFEAVMKAVMEAEWADKVPLFEELNLRVTLPCRDFPLPYGEEHISLAEALHEELYFSLLEHFQHRAGLPLGDRSVQPGQIVPEILTRSESPPGVIVCLKPLCKEEHALPEPEYAAVDTAERLLSASQVLALLLELGTVTLQSQSRSGRPVVARYRSGEERAILISAGQHANETSGIIGALRAAAKLDECPQSHFVISPLENPDGYYLCHRLVAEQPNHMHHAARYTAFGNDLQAQQQGGGFEHAIREQAVECSGAMLHVNLHGYPAHEWTRPLTGYVPRGFEMWTIPKGFFLIVRYHTGWEDLGRKLLELVTIDLAEVPGLVDFNRRQIDVFESHAGRLSFDVMNNIPYLAYADDEQLTPLMLITEYPDETVYGEAFVSAHEVQKATVLSAYRHFQNLELPIG